MDKRRTTPTVRVGDVMLGSDHPVRVQSMTNTNTEDVEATARQIQELTAAGSELVRITVNTEEAARAVPRIHEILEREGISTPLVGDFHYNGHILLRDFPACARVLDKYRINPGNVGTGTTRDANFTQMIEVALRYDKPVRIGVNWGSLDKNLLARLMDENAQRPNPKDAHSVLLDATVQSALESAQEAEALGLAHNKIILSAKLSCVEDVVEVNRTLAGMCDYPLHVGLTEAGMGRRGVVVSTAALSILLTEGIGDTIRVSLTPAPGASRTEEVLICRDILQSLGMRAFKPSISACPGCGRTTSTFFVEMASDIDAYINEQMPRWEKDYHGVENLKIAVMGCIVNGPGESKYADIGISLPGTGEDPKAPVFMDGRLVTTLSGPRIVQEFIVLLNKYIEERFSQ